jgi:hypothetical protein
MRYTFGHSIKQKVKNQRIPVYSIIGALSSGTGEFLYALYFSSNKALVDLSIMAALVIPTYVGCYLDRKVWEKILSHENLHQKDSKNNHACNTC